MSTPNKLCKVVQSMRFIRRYPLQRPFSSTVVSSQASTSSETTPKSLPQQEITTGKTNDDGNRLGTNCKRPFSSVAVYHHDDKDDCQYEPNNIDVDHFVNHVKRNHDTIQGTRQVRRSNTSFSARGFEMANGSCCYTLNNAQNEPRFPCGSDHHEDELSDLPPPLEEPKYSVHKRVLPTKLTSFSSTEGKRFLLEALAGNTAESYWKLTEHFVNQSDPAFCGVTTLLMCLNAMCIDPNVRWRGGWRYYGSEDVLLNRCCFSAERIRRKGIVLEDFARLGRCHGLGIELKRPRSNELHTTEMGSDVDDNQTYSIRDFRNDIKSILTDAESQHKPILVVSFSRSSLGQTGDGHFSPVAAYHEETDQVLILDVARFKYSPYWVGVDELFASMREVDAVTEKPRGWFVLSPPDNHVCMHDDRGQEARMPIEFVPKVGEPALCPISDIKIHFCKGN